MASSGSPVDNSAGLSRRLHDGQLNSEHTDGQGRKNAMRVLVIEDDKETAQFLQKSLKENGHTADLAADGEAGLALATDNAYDVLIVDRMLPHLDGLSVIKALRAEGNRTPALILSALGEVDDRVKGLRAGGDDYLTKPSAAGRCRRSSRRATRSAISFSIAFHIA